MLLLFRLTCEFKRYAAAERKHAARTCTVVAPSNFHASSDLKYGEIWIIQTIFMDDTNLILTTENYRSLRYAIKRINSQVRNGAYVR